MGHLDELTAWPHQLPVTKMKIPVKSLSRLHKGQISTTSFSPHYSFCAERQTGKLPCIVMQEASDALSKTADSDTVSTYQVSSVQLVTDKKLEAFNKA